jgi:hypothetical protein
MVFRSYGKFLEKIEVEIVSVKNKSSLDKRKNLSGTCPASILPAKRQNFYFNINKIISREARVANSHILYGRSAEP